MLCWYKDAMKKIVYKGGKATVLWGVSDNPVTLPLPNNLPMNTSNIMEFQ